MTRETTNEQPGNLSGPLDHISADGLPEVMTSEECRRFLKVGRSRFYESIRTGAIPHVKVGKLIRISRRALLTWLETGKVEAGNGN